MKKILMTGVVYVLLINSSFSRTISPNDISQTIRGTVTDKITKTPLAGAIILLPGSNPVRGTVTNNDGTFTLEKVPVGRINLKISLLGYEDILFSNIELTSGKELILNIEMEEKVISNKEVVISAYQDKTEAQNKLITVSSRMFTVEETKRYAGSSNDVGRMAANFAGVNGLSDARNDIIIRGNSPIGLIWRLEGVDIPSPNHWAGFGVTGGPVCMLNNNLLANSDFITAAFPAEYGNGISGVFDLKLRNGNNQHHEFLGQIGFNGFEANAEGPISKKNGSSYLFSYRISTYEVVNSLGVNFGTGTAVPKYQDMSFKINYPKTRIGSFSVFGLGGTSWIQMNFNPQDTNGDNSSLYSDGGPQNIGNGSRTGVIGLNHTGLINPSTYIKTTLAVSYHDSKTVVDTINRNNFETIPYYRDFSYETKYTASVILNKKINTHHNYKTGFLVSLSQYNLFDSVLANGRFISMFDYKGNNLSIRPFASWQYKITDRLVFNGGLLLFYFHFNNSLSLEPRIGLKWKFKPNQAFSIGFGKHSQANPAMIYFYQAPLADSIHFVRPNINLDLIKSYHFVVGYDWNINENMRLKSEVYYQYISNAGIYGGNSLNEGSYSLLNQGANFGIMMADTMQDGGTGRNYGIELTLERFLNKGFYLLMTGSLYDSKYKGRDGQLRNTVFNGNYTANLLMGKEFILNQRKNKKDKGQKILNIDFKTVYAGGQRYTPLNEVESTRKQEAVYFEDQAFSLKYKDYFRCDISIGFKINGKNITQEFKLDFTNITNQKNIFTEYFNRNTCKKDYMYQVGFMVMPLFRLTF